MFRKRLFYLVKCVYSLIDLSSYMMTKVQQIKKSFCLQSRNMKSFSALAQAAFCTRLSLLLFSWVRGISILEWEHIKSVFLPPAPYLSPSPTVLFCLKQLVTVGSYSVEVGSFKLHVPPSFLCFPLLEYFSMFFLYQVQQKHSKKNTIYQAVLQEQNTALHICLLGSEGEWRALTDGSIA